MAVGLGVLFLRNNDNNNVYRSVGSFRQTFFVGFRPNKLNLAAIMYRIFKNNEMVLQHVIPTFVISFSDDGGELK